MSRGSVLRDRALLALTAAEVVSAVGSRMTFLALPWFVLVTTGSPTRMAFVLAAELLPMGLVGIPSGSLVSRIGARTTMLVSDLVRVPLMALLPILHAAGVLSFPVLLVLVFAFGVFWAPYFACQRVILPELLGEDEGLIGQANSVIEGATRTAGLLGPPLAGVLIGWLGAANVLYVDAGTFLFSFVAVALFVPRREPVPGEETGGVLAGIRFLLRDALMGPLAGVIVSLNALGQLLGAALPVLAFERYGDPHVAGWLFAAFGFGGIAGTVLAFRLVTRLDPLKLSSVAMAVIALPLWALVFKLPLAVLLPALAVSSAGSPLVNAPMLALLTSRTPAELRAKMMTAVITLATVAGPLGVLAAGFLLEHAGLAVTFAVSAGGTSVSAAVFVALLGRYARSQAAPTSSALPADSPSR